MDHNSAITLSSFMNEKLEQPLQRLFAETIQDLISDIIWRTVSNCIKFASSFSSGMNALNRPVLDWAGETALVLIDYLWNAILTAARA